MFKIGDRVTSRDVRDPKDKVWTITDVCEDSVRIVGKNGDWVYRRPRALDLVAPSEAADFTAEELRSIAEAIRYAYPRTCDEQPVLVSILDKVQQRLDR